MTREQAIAAFIALDDAGFGVRLDAQAVETLALRSRHPLRAMLRPCDSVTLKKLEETLEPLELDYRADSLTSPFGGGVTFNIFSKGARSYPV